MRALHPLRSQGVLYRCYYVTFSNCQLADEEQLKDSVPVSLIVVKGNAKSDTKVYSYMRPFLEVTESSPLFLLCLG